MASIGGNYDYEAPGEGPADTLYKAMKGLGTDEDTVTSVLGTHSNEQLLEIRQTYQTMHGEDLIERIGDEDSGYFGKCCVALVKERMDFMAQTVYDALKGAGTSEQILIDIFGTISPEVLEELSAKYEEKFESNMKDDVTDDVGGTFKKFLFALMSGGRVSDYEDVDYDQAAEDAQKLYDAGEGTLGTDEGAFMSVFMLRSWSQLVAMFEAYAELAGDDEGKSLLAVVQREFSGNEEKLLSTIVKYAQDRENGDVNYYAEVLRECMEGIGTSEGRLIYHIVTRCEVDLGDIRDAYNDKYGEDLAERVASEVGSDLGALLNLLIAGNC